MRARSLLAVAVPVSVLHVVLLLAMAPHRSAAVARTSPAAAHWIVLAAPAPYAGPADSAVAAAARVHQRPARRDAPPPSRAREVAEADVHALPASPPADRNAAIGIYRAATVLDVPVRPRSAPDIAMLADLPWSGLPLRLRLFIDEQGKVVDARILQSAESEDVAERVRRMFLATGFTAGVEGGRPVPSYKDIELTIGTPS